jgi:hypothetical protein
MIQVAKRRTQSNELKLCECGCGELIPTITTEGKPARYKHGHYNRLQPRGSESPFWKGGVTIHGGYRVVKLRGHPRADKQGYVKEQVLVLERKIGRHLRPEEIPHHINGIKTDNRPENLQLVRNQAEHMRIHKTKSMENRYCLICKRGSHEVPKDKRINRPAWYNGNEEGTTHICSSCYRNEYEKKRNKKKQLLTLDSFS